MSYSIRSNRKHSNNFNRSKRPNSRQYNSSKRTVGEYINPSRYIKAATISEAQAYVAQNTFSDFPIEELLKNNLLAKGYSTPSPIQDQAIPAALQGRDVIGIADTGTGKTAAFLVPVLQKLVTNKSSAVIIIAPTRELAQQIEGECRTLAKGSGLLGALLIGGTGMGSQLRDLRSNPNIVIGTPGRIKDHLQRGTLKLEKFDIVVLDEVDRMLDMGFINDVTKILSHTNPQRQSFFFSATIDNRVRSLIDAFTKEPFTISLKASSTSENVHQDVIRFQDRTDKVEKLHDVLIKHDVSKVIVFEETQRNVEKLNKELISRGFITESIHGGKTQGQRQRALAKFKSNEINILVATDVAARGIDVDGITHVINFSVPKMFDDYIHRIGRAGRAGKIGHALTFISH